MVYVHNNQHMWTWTFMFVFAWNMYTHGLFERLRLKKEWKNQFEKIKYRHNEIYKNTFTNRKATTPSTFESIITPISLLLLLLMCNNCSELAPLHELQHQKIQNWLFTICSSKFAYPLNFTINIYETLLYYSSNPTFIRRHSFEIRLPKRVYVRGRNGIQPCSHWWEVLLSQIYSFQVKITSKITQLNIHKFSSIKVFRENACKMDTLWHSNTSLKHIDRSNYGVRKRPNQPTDSLLFGG